VSVVNIISPCVFCYYFLKLSDCFIFPVPGPVISAVAFSFGKDWIDLRWQAPYPPLGELEIYKVAYKLQYSPVYKIKEVSVTKMCELWNESICFRLDSSSDGITGNKVYDIQVSDSALISLD
jgi:hypothetical protein